MDSLELGVGKTRSESVFVIKIEASKIRVPNEQQCNSIPFQQHTFL
jgi:hypothetical protein